MTMQTTEQGAEVDPAIYSLLTGELARSIGMMAVDIAAGLEMARMQLRRGAHAEALKTYATLVLCDPSNTDSQVGLANCALEAGESHLALQAASAVVALAPTDPRGYYLSGRACFAMGAFAEAQEDLADARTFARKARDSRIDQAAESLGRTIDLLRAGTASEPGRA